LSLGSKLCLSVSIDSLAISGDFEVERKNTHLIDFFEATTQFLGTLMQVRFHSNVQYFQSTRATGSIRARTNRIL